MSNIMILEDMGVIKGYRKVKCKCNCGNMFIAPLQSVKNGTVKSCNSCSKENKLSKKCKEIINTVINNCTITNAYYLIKENNRKRLFVDSKCNSCGYEFSIRYDTLKGLRGNNCPKCNIKANGENRRKQWRNTKLYRVYHGIQQRCHNKNNRAYKYYGARGIKMCDEWRNDFEAFYNWANNHGYKPNLQIDRIDTNKDYEPDNCQWIDSSTNNYNKRNNILVLYKDEWRTIQYISDKEHISWSTAYYRYIKKLKSPVKYLYGGGRIGGKSN